MPPSASNKARGSFAIISPKAELAKNALAERIKAGKPEDEGAEAEENLSEGERIDFLSTYDEERWWIKPKPKIPVDRTTNSMQPQDVITEQNEDEEDAKSAEEEEAKIEMIEEASDDDNEEKFPSLEKALTQDFNIYNVTSLKQRFSDVKRQPRNVNELYPAPL